jgi:hypothetical protein
LDPGDRERRPGIELPSIHRTKNEAVRSARELVRAHEPSQLLVYKEVGTVQTERTCG